MSSPFTLTLVVSLPDANGFSGMAEGAINKPASSPPEYGGLASLVGTSAQVHRPTTECCVSVKAIADAGEERGWTPVDDGPVFRYVRWLREDDEERIVPPDLRLRTVYLVELVCPPDRSMALAEEGLRGRLEDVASNAIANARVSGRWRVDPIDPIRVKRVEFDLDERTRVPVPAAYRAAPGLDTG